MRIITILFLITFSVTHCKAINATNVLCPQKNFVYVQDMVRSANDDCENKKCIAKCCPPGEHLNNTGGSVSCIKSSAEDFSKLQVYEDGVKTNVEPSGTVGENNFTFVYDAKFLNKSCASKLFHSIGDVHFYFLKNGSLGLKIGTAWKPNVRQLEYCIDYEQGNKGLGLSYLILGAIEEDFKAVEKVVAIGMLVSSIFLFITLFVYCLLPQLRNINGMIQMAHMFALMMMFLFKFALETVHTRDFCRVVVPIYYFCLISNFLWLALMSFNIWWTFRGTIHHNKIHRRGEMLKFIIYCVCVCGIASLPTTFAIIMDNIDPKKVPFFLVTPKFSSCLSNEKALILYIYIPVGIVTMLNCTMFVMTLYNIWKIKRGIEKFTSSESRKNNATVNNFKVYTKLSVIMGIGWILEVMQSFMNISKWAYLLMNFYNAYIGVVIFILFISDKKHIIMLLKRFNIKSKLTTENTSMKQSGHTGSTRIDKTQERNAEAMEFSNFSGAMESDEHKRDSS